MFGKIGVGINMKRNTFEAESRLVGEDFDKLIDREGGKSAGLHLLRRGIDQFVKAGKLKTSCAVGTVDWLSLGTDHYVAFEKMLRKLVRKYHSSKDKESFESSAKRILSGENFRTTIYQMTNLCAKRFESERFASSGVRASGFAPQFHLRSSTTLEDFKDDRYFGTFSTKPGLAFFYIVRTRPCGSDDLMGTEAIVDLMIDFYSKKHLSEGGFEIGEKEKMGLVLMPTIGLYGDRDVISYSSYPEDPSAPSVIETWTRGCLDGKIPLELIVAKSSKDVKRIAMNARQTRSDGESLTAEQVSTIYTLGKVFEDALEYPVNIESVVLNEGIVPVQIRPVPTLSENRAVKQLSSVPENMHLVAETPFVMGSYSKTARLVMAHYKNDYLEHKFTEPVIMWHSDGRKGFRFYYSDDNCIAMLNPEQGAALTHDSSLLPGFGEERERYAFIGLPIPGFKEKLEKCMVVREEKTGKKEKGKFSYTPFPITIESDGRRGRVLVEKANAHYFIS